jgi:hypothetical protein
MRKHKNYLGKHEGKTALGRTSRRWEECFKIDLQVWCEAVDWIKITWKIVQ